ncbi:MAG: 5-dehydro-2-deoxygluconokinase [Actinomycetota bacterium]|nr:5-dehydro-2-deoxygluconokinase [Candidatus Dormibacteraeota bacterium]MDQ6916142.1 5-dehydro-2-deoxygluconokinase [Actinomycetota bacterium]
MGRVSVDLYPQQVGVELADVDSFKKDLGGSATNVAVAAARLGHPSAVVTRVGDDAFGVYVRRALAGFGVSDRFVGTEPGLRTPLAFCAVLPPDDFPLLFYREPRAPDMNLSVNDLDLDAIGATPLFWTTGTGLSDEPSRTATLAAMGARRRRAITVHDLDHRPMLWARPEDAGRYARDAVALATVVVGNQDEVEVATGTRDPERAAALLLEAGVELAIVKQGLRGVYARRGAEAVLVPSIPVRTLCGLGAGDAFGGALCHGLLRAWELERLIRFANAAGAIVASRLTCASEMPTEEEVEALIASADAAAAGGAMPRV